MKKYNDTFTMSNPQERKQMEDVIVQYLKDVIIPHEKVHIKQETENKGDFGINPEQDAERAEDWGTMNEMGYRKK